MQVAGNGFKFCGPADRTLTDTTCTEADAEEGSTGRPASESCAAAGGGGGRCEVTALPAIGAAPVNDHSPSSKCGLQSSMVVLINSYLVGHVIIRLGCGAAGSTRRGSSPPTCRSVCYLCVPGDASQS